MRRLVLLAAVLLLGACGVRDPNRIVVGSKNFTEQVVLAELLAQHLEERTGLEVERRFYLGGTYICHQSLLAGRLDLYVEYTGTALTAILKEQPRGSRREVYERVREAYAERFDLVVAEPLGFENTFAIVVRGDDARKHSLETISDVARLAPAWRPGFGYEFMERPDGYQGLVETYNLKFGQQPRIMALGLLYRALKKGQVDLVAGNSTDGLIAALDLVVLEDDRSYFPPYEAVPIVRQETLARHPVVREALGELAGKISTEEIRRLNYALDGEHRDVEEVVRAFRRSQGL